MEERKKGLLKNVLLYGGLALLVAFVVITCIVVNYKRKQLDRFNDANKEMEEVIGEQENSAKMQNIENFSKNLLNFIDNEKII